MKFRHPDGKRLAGRTLDGKEQWHLMRSKAFRRACVGHGIGRYLYSDSDLEGDTGSARRHGEQGVTVNDPDGPRGYHGQTV